MSNNEYIETNEYLNNDNDVISFSPISLFKISRIKGFINSFISHGFVGAMKPYFEQEGIKGDFINSSSFCLDGQECEILKVGSNGWKKGKVRLKITLEFIPDEPEINQMESPLDDIRQTMNQSN